MATMQASQDWQLDGSDGELILGTTDTPPARPVGVLIVCHGFKGYMDYGLFPPLARAAARRGLLVHRFNFSHSGMTRRIETFERPDLFERDTWGKQIADLHTVTRAVAEGRLEGSGLPSVWFGHSRGGVTVTLAAARAFDGDAPGTPPPDGVITASAPVEACSLSEQDRQTLRQHGRLLSPSGRTGQRLFVGKAWLDEIEADPDAFDPALAATRVACPALMLHGGADRTVPTSAAISLAQRFPHAELEVIGDASHTFDCPNPLAADATPPPATQRMIERAVAFATDRCTA